MCLPLDCWLCMPRTVVDDLPPASRSQHAQRKGGTGSHYSSNGNGGHHYNGYTAHEADRKASNDARRGPVHAGVTGAQEKAAAAAAYPYAAGADGTLKQQQKAAAYPYAGAHGTLKQQQPAASNGRVAADGHGARGGAPHNYYERAQLPAHREDAADSYYPPAATATADHESPSEALGGE